MSDGSKVDFSKYLAALRSQSGGRSETEQVSRQVHVERETRPQAEKERYPDYFQRQLRERGR